MLRQRAAVTYNGDSMRRLLLGGTVHLLLRCLVLLSVFTTSHLASSQIKQAPPAVSVPVFSDEEATSVLDNLQTALQSYNRKKFLSEFDSATFPGFAAFETQIKSLFDEYDSFLVTYRLKQTAVQNGNGVVLADFGLDATSSENEGLDLRRHTQLRIVVAWNGKEWKIVDLSPREIFYSSMATGFRGWQCQAEWMTQPATNDQ